MDPSLHLPGIYMNLGSHRTHAWHLTHSGWVTTPASPSVPCYCSVQGSLKEEQREDIQIRSPWWGSPVPMVRGQSEACKVRPRREGGAETQTGRQSRKTMPRGHPPLPACLSFQWAPAKGSPRWGSGPSCEPSAPLPLQPVLPLTRLALRNYGLVIGSNADHAVCGPRGRQSEDSREGGQEDVAGEVAGLGFSFLTTQGSHLPGGSLFPDLALSYPQPRRYWKRDRPCLAITDGGWGSGRWRRGHGASFRAQAKQSPLFWLGGGGLPLDLDHSPAGNPRLLPATGASRLRVKVFPAAVPARPQSPARW